MNMMPPRPPQLEETPTGLRIVMRPERSGCAVAFLATWFVGWAVGEVTAIVGLFGGTVWVNGMFLGSWLLAWTAAGVAVAAFLLFLIGGAEIVSIEPEGVSRRIEAFGRGFTRVYPASEVRNFRALGVDNTGERNFLAFDHRGGTLRFGTALSESTAVRIAEQVWATFPALKQS